MLEFKTLSPAVLPAQSLLAVDRCRWQIEIAIKRWKSVLDVDALRAKAQSPLAEVWLHGKLLYALLVERRMRRTLGADWGRLDRQRQGTWWRVWGMLKERDRPRDYRGVVLEGRSLGGLLEGFGRTPPPASLTTAPARRHRPPLSSRD